jgi:cytoskeleton protein RodZ
VTLTEKVLTGVGAALKQGREAAGLAIADVAERLKLLPRQIESLEHERFDRLPGPAIARGMVRNYARLLGLDAEALLQRMAWGAEQAPERGQIAGGHPEQLPSSNASRRSTTLYVGFSVALLVLIGAFAYDWQRQEKAAAESAESPAPAQATVPQAPPAVLPPPVHRPLESAVQEPAAPPPEVAKARDKPKPEAAAQPALAPGVHRLVLRMEQEAWIEVREGTGRSLVSSLNPAGTERAVRGRPPFELVIGNAAHVRLTYDGNPVDLEPHIRGEVARLTLN